MTEARKLDAIRHWLALAALALGLILAMPAWAQPGVISDDNISAELIADGPPEPGEEWMLALHFTPVSEEWHGYWANPGDAGLGMELEWSLPDGWEPGKPQYPVPARLLIGGLMNHVYEGPYSVLVPIRVPDDAAVANPAPISVVADYLACTDKICVPQRATLALDPSRATRDPRFDEWLARIVPQLDSPASFEISGERLRIGVPLPAGVQLGDLHAFVDVRDLGEGLRPAYAEIQTFIREGDLLVAEIPLIRSPVPDGFEPAATPETFTGILAFDEDRGIRFTASAGDVPLEGVKPLGRASDPSLAILILAALVGGLLLNIMPCVFPILSLKALALAKAGGQETAAKRDALAYTAGVVLACAGLGAVLLLLRSAGEQVGWAFQLQEPGIVIVLFLLASALTANFLGLFEIPGFAISGDRPSSAGSFSTGLLAAFVATPCTGPFMAAALGAALLLPPTNAMALFVALGLGLALPFLLVGFVPSLRSRLPRPGAWMESFRRWMALPMGLTALALAWLVWRIGGAEFLAAVAGLGAIVLALLWVLGRSQRAGRSVLATALAVPLSVGLGMALLIPEPEARVPESGDSLLEPVVFSQEALAAARASGQPVFVWFTADWCVTCKVNERIAIERESTRAAFKEAGVVAMRGDWTQRDAEIARFLSQQGAAGVPLYLWYPAGGSAEQLPQVLTPDLLADLPRRQAPPPRR